MRKLPAFGLGNKTRPPCRLLRRKFLWITYACEKEEHPEGSKSYCTVCRGGSISPSFHPREDWGLLINLWKEGYWGEKVYPPILETGITLHSKRTKDWHIPDKRTTLSHEFVICRGAVPQDVPVIGGGDGGVFVMEEKKKEKGGKIVPILYKINQTRNEFLPENKGKR